MGYITYARGVITITPPIPYAEIKDSPFLPDGDDDLNVKFVVSQEERHTAEGILTVIAATGVEQRHESEPRNYDIVRHLQDLIDAYPGHEFTGRFDCEGESNGDMWRVKVVGRKARRFEPTLIWPEASE